MSPRRQAPRLRRCLACRGWALGPDMFRFARLAEGEWVVASSGGRGYYVHRDPVCVERAMAPKALGRLMGAAAAARLRADLGVATTGAF